MELEKEDSLKFKLSLGVDKNKVSREEKEIIEKKEKEITEFFDNLWGNIINFYKNAENYYDFEINIFKLWYDVDDRFLFLLSVLTLLNYYKISIPTFFLEEKKLLEKDVKYQESKNKKQNNKIFNNEKEKGYLHDVIHFGNSKIEIYSNKEENVKEKLSKEFENENKYDVHEKVIKEAEEILLKANSYGEYRIKLKPLYFKLYKESENIFNFELTRGFITYGIPHRRKEWKKEIPNKTAVTFQSVDVFSKEEAETVLREEYLFNFYKNEKYIIRSLIFNNSYSIKEREEKIIDFLNLIKKDESLYEFVSSSVEKQVKGFLNHEKEFIKGMNKLKEERVLIYQDFINELKKSKFFESLSENQKNELQKLYENIYIVWSEGENCQCLNKVKEILKLKFNVKFYDGGGKNEMVKNFKYLIKNNHKIKTIFLFDCDAEKEYKDCYNNKTEYILPLIIPYNETNDKVVHGIENLFNKELFNERFYEKEKKNKPDGGYTEIERLNKKSFCNYVCYERNNIKDFNNFVPIFKEIEQFFRNED